MEALKYLESPKFCLDHAGRRYKSFATGIQAWTQEEALVRVVEFDPARGQDQHKLRLTKPIPDAVKGDLIDCIASLRNALDHSTRAASLAAGTTGKRSAFPFGNDEVNSRSRAGKGSSSADIPTHVFEAIMTGCRPWKGSGTPLYALNDLANRQKHEEVITIAAITKQANITIAQIEGDLVWPPRWNHEKSEMLLGYSEPGQPLKMIYQLECVPAIRNCSEWGDCEAVPTLQTMLKETIRCVKLVFGNAFPELVTRNKKTV